MDEVEPRVKSLSVNEGTPIKFVNNTGKTDRDVIIFSKRHPKQSEPVYVAWQVLRCQTSVDLVYPLDFQVGTSYIKGIQSVNCGPFDTQLGSMWEMRQHSQASVAILVEKTGIEKAQKDCVTVINVPPKDWNGRMYDVGIYKMGFLYTLFKNLHVGDQVDFIIDHKLCFGMSTNVLTGDLFSSLKIVKHPLEVDMQQFPCGLKVVLNEEPIGGKHTFTTGPLEDSRYV